ncbi:COP1-interactive protein 1 [Abeliophyllum distichum]|uniref:COP1-interactive protein 1 n=1 Tax=Abeliophyllum distichum TaxID=126358 RepID=A0ABD1URJ5_9LAMI
MRSSLFIAEIESKVKRILKLTKNINQGNKDGNQKKKSELVHLVEDFQKQYESLYSLYEDLRGEVKKKVNGGDYESSASTTDSESYYSPDELNTEDGEIGRESPEVPHGDEQERETSDFEDTILKDKLTSTSEVKETIILGSESPFSNFLQSGETLKDLGIQNGESESTKQILLDSSVLLKGRFVEREELLSLIKELEDQVEKWKLESDTLSTQRRKLEEQIECKSNEAEELKEKNSSLEAKVFELEATFKEKESQFFDVRKKFEENKKFYLSRIEGLEAQANNLQLEIKTSHTQKDELEEQSSCETTKGFSQVEDLMERVDLLQQELDCMRSQKARLELELEMRSKETSECLIKIKNLNDNLTNRTLNEQGALEEKEDLQVHITDLELEVHSLSSQKSDMEEQIMSINHEAYQSKAEKEELDAKNFELQRVLLDRENEPFTRKRKFKDYQNTVSALIASLTEQVKILEKKLDALQTEKDGLQLELEALQNEKNRLQIELERDKSEKEKSNIELNNKVSDQQRIRIELEDVVSKLKDKNKQVQTRFADSKLNFQIAERKVEEMVEELRKQFEDNLRILSQRIRIAEQLHTENKDWYRKKKEMYEQENRDISHTAKGMLNSIDTVTLKLEECNANFMNRISKASCELKFSKDWAMRKNKALVHVREDSDCLLAQLDEKEAEILLFRERLWKSENKVREVEKMMKEKEEAMLGLQEEKREAIRQLCVWIDYHRSRSDYYKKILSEITPPGRRTAS